MPEGNFNDNDLAHGQALTRSPDPHGQAAMLLVESLLHALVDGGVLSRAEAGEVVATAIDVKREVASELGESAAGLEQSLALLGAVSMTLAIDAGDRPLPR